MSTTLRSVKGSQLTQAEMDANFSEAGWGAADMASAATVDLNTATGNVVKITGTTSITSFGSAAPVGTLRVLILAGAITIVHGANMLTPAGLDWVGVTGDVLTFVHRGGGQWRCVSFLDATGDITAANLIATTMMLAKLVAFNAVFDNGSTPGATPTFNLNNGARQKVTLNASFTPTITAPPGPGVYHIDFFQDATGGRIATWPASFKWPGNYAAIDKALSTAASARDRLVIDYDGTNYVANLMKGIA